MPTKQITAEILTIGDEILYGQTLDTNSHWISGELDQLGIRVIRKTTVGDNETSIIKGFTEAESRADIVLITGGLGPTSDDLTKPLLAKYFDVKMDYNQEWLDIVTNYFKSKGRELLDVNRDQALLPTNATMLKNMKGTAPGMWFFERETVFVSMPGVPYEMEYLMVEEVMPRLKKQFELPFIHHKMIRTIGIGESDLANKVKDWETTLPENIRLAYLPSLAEVKIRLTGVGSDKDLIISQVEKDAEKFFALANKYIYGYGEESIQSAIGVLLLNKKLTVATAESCSGGYVSHLITSVPGSSRYFLGGVISYSNEVKEEFLNVSLKTLKEHGAVSEPVVTEMADNVRTKFKSDIGLAISGIAGPDGGTEAKPVGTIWIAYSDSKGTVTKKLQYNRDRIINIKASSKALLNLLRIQLVKLS